VLYFANAMPVSQTLLGRLNAEIPAPCSVLLNALVSKNPVGGKGRQNGDATQNFEIAVGGRAIREEAARCRKVAFHPTYRKPCFPTLASSRRSRVLFLWLGEGDVSYHLSRTIQSFERGHAISTELQHSAILFVRILQPKEGVAALRPDFNAIAILATSGAYSIRIPANPVLSSTIAAQASSPGRSSVISVDGEGHLGILCNPHRTGHTCDVRSSEESTGLPRCLLSHG
jgi:hypothetical protein